MADNTKPIPPVPNKADILEAAPKDSKQVSVTWIRWFVQLRDKINLINTSIANLAGFSGTGFLSSDGAGTFTGRTIEGSAGNISVTDGDGVGGNPVIDLVDTAVTPGSYTNTNVTVDEFGRITAAANGSASGSPLTTKGDIFGFSTADARIPVGTDGDVLTADSTAAAGVSYKPPGTPTLPVTTKGDLLGFSTVPARIPVGSNGQLLSADSTSGTGVSWVAAGYPKGTSFPGSPSTNDIFFRTDLCYLCYYDGTQWMTVEEYVFPSVQLYLLPVTAIDTLYLIPIRTDFSMYLTRWVVSSYTKSGTRTVSLVRFTAAAVATTIASFSTSGDPANTMIHHDQAINANVDTAAVYLGVNVSGTGSTYVPSILYGRLIIT